jgi:hypothetical protein
MRDVRRAKQRKKKSIARGYSPGELTVNFSQKSALQSAKRVNQLRNSNPSAMGHRDSLGISHGNFTEAKHPCEIKDTNLIFNNVSDS